jgi:triosephosphate isomerase
MLKKRKLFDQIDFIIPCKFNGAVVEKKNATAIIVYKHVQGLLISSSRVCATSSFG